MPWKQLVALLLVLGTLGSAIAFFEYIKRFFSWSRKWLNKPWGSGQPPRRITFAITPDYSQCHWQEGRRGDAPHMLIICGLHITNAGPAHQGQVIDAYIRRPLAPQLHEPRRVLPTWHRTRHSIEFLYLTTRRQLGRRLCCRCCRGRPVRRGKHCGRCDFQVVLGFPRFHCHH